MKQLAMMNRKLQLTGLLIAVALLLVACGDHLIRGVSPIVRMNELSHDGKTVTVQMTLRNRNGVAMDVEHMNFSLTSDGADLLVYDGPAITSIAANGTENWSVDAGEPEATNKKLNMLESDEITSLLYTIKGTITSTEAGALDFDYEGYLYPVPGRPGRFR